MLFERAIESRRVSSIYHTEPTTKNCKSRKTKKPKTDMLRSNGKSLGNHVVNPEEEKERLRWEGFAEKEGFHHPLTLSL